MNCQNDMGEVSTQTGSDSKKSHCLESHKLPPHSITLTAWPPSLKPHFQAQAAFNMWIWSSLPALNLLMITFKIMFKWLAEWLSMIWSLPLSLGHSFSHFLLLSIKSLAVPYKIWDYKLNFSFRWKKKVLVQVCSQYWMRHMKILFFVYLKFKFHWASCIFIW